MSKHLSVTLISAILLFTTLAFACDPGYYYAPTPNDLDRCLPCDYGYYCPGNDSANKCPPGTISTRKASTSCMKCPAASNEERTVCFATDLPSDAKEIKHGQVLLVDNKQPTYYYISIQSDIDTLNYDPLLGSEVTFLNNIKGFENSSVLVYGSIAYGKPTKENSLFGGRGINATLYAPNYVQSPVVYIVYLSVITLSSHPVTVSVAVYSGVSKFVNVKSTNFYEHVYINDQRASGLNSVQFTFENVPGNSRINFTTILNNNNYDMIKPYTLYHSTFPTILYPNPFNSNMAVHSTTKKELKTQTSLVANQIEDGPFVVTLEYGGTMDVMMSAQIQVSPLRK
ncbi:predicted protein [Naegleria gruberi]|uniref:Predicted protein n=1 Tax=Naegleria gruberi TaxID=5762 RepID=D2VYT1_NAEGR|nr:uncharacterized protein NAEGRDRAFT_74230 [Naegleria gruberi]EFC38012.1 predicted protein [Naegleria gruberi]|eukprot:XP_002670756.1 predicted protein [Naegleria gruberi strain NEG-M]